jgi:hypothetical protein
MSVLKFEVFINDTYLYEASTIDELRESDSRVTEYLKSHPEIDKEHAKVHVNIKREPCRGCK